MVKLFKIKVCNKFLIVIYTSTEMVGKIFDLRIAIYSTPKGKAEWKSIINVLLRIKNFFLGRKEMRVRLDFFCKKESFSQE